MDLRKIYAFLLLNIILIIPAVSSFYYSYDKKLLWFVGSLSFLFFISFSVISLSEKVRNQVLSFFTSSVILSLVLFFEFIRLISFYLQGEGFNDRFFFHFNLNTIQEAGASYPGMVFLIIFLILGLNLSIYLCKKGRLFNNIPIYLSSMIMFASLPLNSATSEFFHSVNIKRHGAATKWSFRSGEQTKKTSPINKFLQSNSIKNFNSTEIAKFDVGQLEKIGFNLNGLNLDTIKQSDFYANPGKNLVLIYLEGIEKIYTDAPVFNGLTPNLKTFMKDGLTFSNINEARGAGWTIAGQVASQCGTPLLYTSFDGRNDIMKSGFLDKANCLGDIFNKAGYYQEYIGGASIRFGGTEDFFRTHKYDEVYGKDELKIIMGDDEYETNWGLYDDSLFDVAADEYAKLANRKSPFNLTIVTMDTHHPTGHPSRSCKPYGLIENSILDAVHCTDQLLKKFIDRISRHPSFKDTIIVLMSDHLAMRNDADKYYPKDYQRRNLFVIINSVEKMVIDKYGTQMDIGPTILETLGIDHNVSFLVGKSLLGIKKAKTQINLNDEKTREAISYINSTFLSKGKYTLCDGEYMAKSINRNSIAIGNKSVFLSLYGLDLHPDEFKEDKAIIAMISDDAEVKSASVTDIDGLGKILLENSDSLFFIVAPSKKLPYSIDLFLDKDEGDISLLFGKLSGFFIDVGNISSIENLQTKSSNCKNLIRSVRNPPESHNELVVNFLKGGNSEGFIQGGWSGQEPWGRWTDGPEASLSFYIDRKISSDLLIHTVAHGFSPDKGPEQYVDVIVNGQARDRWFLKHHEDKMLRTIIPKEVALSESPVSIVFRIGHPSSPYISGISNDKRKLGMGMIRMRIVYSTTG